ncbi:hypothetical protein T484DRAFT_1835731, partial [Baffinella frigidus]
RVPVYDGNIDNMIGMILANRIPVYDDNIDNIIGMILAKSLIDVLDRPNGITELFDSGRCVADLMDPAYYVPESMTVWNALETVT